MFLGNHKKRKRRKKKIGNTGLIAEPLLTDREKIYASRYAAMHLALEPHEELYAKGKYVVRLINRFLNQLDRINRKVS